MATKRKQKYQSPFNRYKTLKETQYLKHEKQKNSREKIERYRKFSYHTNTKLSRLSHEELMIPLIYWNCPPQHSITAMYIQKSKRSGDIIITGSSTGEFILWKPLNTIHHPSLLNNNNNNKSTNIINKWVPIAMTFSTNTTPIVSILGSFQHKEQAAFMAAHADGETVIFSVYGAGALKIGCGERPIVRDGISGIYGYGLLNESYKYCVCTNFYNHNLHIIDLHKGKQINHNLSSNILPMSIISVTFFELELNNHCAIIDSRGKIATFNIITNDNNNNIAVEPQLNFESRLTNQPIEIGITFDNQYLCAISNNEFVLFANDPLRFIEYYKIDNDVCWDGMIVLDKYFYGIINNKNKSNKSIYFKSDPSLSRLVDSNYLLNSNDSPSPPNPSIPDRSYSNISYTSNASVTTPSANIKDDIAYIRPFFILIWENGSKYLTLYLVSKDTQCILTPIVRLNIPLSVLNDNNNNYSDYKWSVVTNDNNHIYVATRNTSIISFNIDELQKNALNTLDLLIKHNWNKKYIGNMSGKIIASIDDGFNTNDIGLLYDNDKKENDIHIDNKNDNNNSSSDDDDDDVINLDDYDLDDILSEINSDDDGVNISHNDISTSCMNITALGVLLCIGYNSGEVYIYSISEGEGIMSIHTRLSCINSLLLLCSDPSSSSGVLFVGYSDGYIEVFDCLSGSLMLSKKCHDDINGGVSKIFRFPQDYYVFSIGNDNTLCSFLVYSQLITMKSVEDLLYDDDDVSDSDNNIRVNWYRGHPSSIINIYRNQWCLISDLVILELSSGDIFVWCVSTSQLERRFLRDESLIFNIDRELYLNNKRNSLPHLTKHEREIYSGNGINHNLLLNKYCNILIYDIRVLGDVTLDREYNLLLNKNQNQNNNNQFQIDINDNDNNNNRKKNKIPKSEINKLSDLLSLLLDWGVSDGSKTDKSSASASASADGYEQLFIQQFRVLITDISPCYGYCGDFESMTLLFPISSLYGGRWRIQPKVTAVYMLAINTICMWLLQCVPTIKLPVCSRLVTYYHVMLPESFNGFVEPSRNSMARYCLNSVSEIRAASRMLLHGIVQRMTDNMRLSLITKWKKRFCIKNTDKKQYYTNKNGSVSSLSLQSQQSNGANINKSNSNSTLIFQQIIGRNGKIPLSVLLGAIVICIIHSLKRNIISDIVSSSVISTLISVLNESVHTNSDMIKISLSCDYLGKVIISWFRYVSDVESLLKLLLNLRNCDYFLLKKSASSALLQCGVAVPQSFIKTMGNEALLISSSLNDPSDPNHNHSQIDTHTLVDDSESKAKAARHEQALMCIINLVQKYPAVLLKHIPLLVSTIIRCLDPSAPRRRKALLSATTASLHVLVTKYPNVSFHQNTQHFAIGTGPARDNCILIYDLRTTTRWKQLKGHRAAVTAIEFNNNGQYLISYSAYERPPTIKCWDIASGGFFTTLLSITNRNYNSSMTYSSKCIKTCPMPPLDRLYPPIDHLQYTKLTWNNKVKGAVKLQRENQSVLFFTVLPK